MSLPDDIIEEAWRDDASALPDSGDDPAYSALVFWVCLAFAFLSVLVALGIEGL